MIKINLLPPEDRKKTRRIKLPAFSGGGPKALWMIAGLVVYAGMIIAVASLQSKSVGDLEAKILRDYPVRPDAPVLLKPPASIGYPLDALEAGVEGRVLVWFGVAAERGGNCELTRADETVVSGGVTVLGPTNLPSAIPYHASQMYSKNITTFLLSLVQKGTLTIDLEDEVVRETLVTRDGELTHPRVRQAHGLPALVPAGAQG